MTTPQSSPLDVDALRRYSLPQLREAWAQHMGSAPVPNQRKVLVRELAWTVQERLHGGLDAQTLRLLNAAVRVAQKRRLVVPGDTGAPLPPKRPRRRPSATGAGSPVAMGKLVTGSRLLRVWPPGGRTTHEVTVLEDGKHFEYRGRIFGSLSQVAHAITGTHWSGPRFFGLACRRRMPDSDGVSP